MFLVQAPVAAVMVLFMVPVFDNIRSFEDADGKFHTGIRDFEVTNYVVFVILLSALGAFCVNLSIYLVIGKSSPISYNVLGHLKLTVIMTGMCL